MSFDEIIHSGGGAVPSGQAPSPPVPGNAGANASAGQEHQHQHQQHPKSKTGESLTRFAKKFLRKTDEASPEPKTKEEAAALAAEQALATTQAQMAAEAANRVPERHAGKGIDADVIVVGGGLSGLAAAKRVRECGFSVLVFEAQDRVGGRIFCKRVDRADLDFGGQFFNPHTHEALGKLAAGLKAGASYVPYDGTGDHVIEIEGETFRYDVKEERLPSVGYMDRLQAAYVESSVDEMARAVIARAPHKSDGGAEWDEQTAQTYVNSALTAGTRGALTATIRGLFGVEPRDVSLLSVLHAVHTSHGLRALMGRAQGLGMKFNGGSSKFVDTLVERIGGSSTVVTSMPVRSIQQGRITARVVTDRNTAFTARLVIVAVPPNMAQRIEYLPNLPPARDQFMQRVPMGSCIVVVLTYRSCFWRDEGLSGMAMSDAGPVSVVFDHTPSDGSQPALCAYVCGQHARELGFRDAPERKRLVIRHVAALVGEDALQPISHVEKDWAQVPWTRGGPVGFFSPGVLTGFGDIMRMPFDKIHWASSELAITNVGTMDGAVESGERAANEAIAKLRAEQAVMPSNASSAAPPPTGFVDASSSSSPSSGAASSTPPVELHSL
jgi:monoamine oxidase